MGFNGFNRCFVFVLIVLLIYLIFEFLRFGIIDLVARGLGSLYRTKHAEGKSLRFDGNLGWCLYLCSVAFIWMWCFNLGGGCLWCGGWGEMKQRQKAVASGAVLV